MSTLPDLSTPPPEVRRDFWGRPYIVPPEGGKAVPYTRTTTYVGVIDDRTALERWKMRMVAIGLARRKDLLLAAAAHADDKSTLNKVCEDALEAAGAGAAATIGTALHSFTEQVDRGQQPQVPDSHVADLAAYTAATADLRALYVEQLCVQDVLRVAGTPDRIVEYRGQRYIADVKTGQDLDYSHLAIAGQLAMYARSRPYDVETGSRLEPHGASLDRGIVIHLPAGQGRCTLLWVDLQVGWENVLLCQRVRQRRQVKAAELLTELHPVPAAPLSLADQVLAAQTPDAVRALWRLHAAEWTDPLTELAKGHIAALATRTTTAPAPVPATQGAPA